MTVRQVLESARERWYVAVPLAVVTAGVLIPLAYLLVRALQAEPAQLADLVLRWRNVRLLGNTVALTAGVLVGTTLVAFPLAWLTTRSNLQGRGLLTLLGVLPLAVPGYVMAYVLLATTGRLRRRWGWCCPASADMKAHSWRSPSVPTPICT
jgi:iron(III) transport system permease protein